MTILGVATSQADFNVVGTTKVTTAAQIGPYVLEGISLGDLGHSAYYEFAANSEVWLTFYNYGASANAYMAATSSGALFTVGSGGTGLVRLYNNASSGQRMEYWNGSSWVSLTSIVALNSSVRYKITFHVKLHDTLGVFRIYIDNALMWEYTGDTILAAPTTVDRVTFNYGYVSNSQSYVSSALVVATTDTRDIVINQNQFASNGTNTAWANDYVSVTKTGVDDTGLISSDTGSQVETYNQSDINTALNALDVVAVVVAARCRKGDSGPSNLQGAARVSGTDYFSANLDPATGFSSKQAIFANNPATSQPWTVAEVNAAEFGFKSIT